MHVRIRADILNSAIHAAAKSGNVRLRYGLIFPNRDNNWLTFDRLAEEVPALLSVYVGFASQWEGDSNPAMTFFSIDPPGTWMRLRSLIGPDAMDPSDLHEQLDSEEALGVVLQHFMPELEKQQDEWNASRYRP